MDNCKKILKRSTGDFEAHRLSDALNLQNTNEEQQKVTIKYKILLNLCEIISKHKVELAVHNPAIGKIIAKEVQQQHNNQ